MTWCCLSFLFLLIDDNAPGAVDVYCDQPGQRLHQGGQQTSRGQKAISLPPTININIHMFSFVNSYSLFFYLQLYSLLERINPDHNFPVR